MGYEIHITRAEDWVEDDNPITIEEVEEIFDKLPKGFSIDRSGVVTAVAPDGHRISAEVGPYVQYHDGNDDSMVCIYFLSGGPSFKVRDEKQILPILELADALNAKIQGDELEIYTRESILGVEGNTGL